MTLLGTLFCLASITAGACENGVCLYQGEAPRPALRGGFTLSADVSRDVQDLFEQLVEASTNGADVTVLHAENPFAHLEAANTFVARAAGCAAALPEAIEFYALEITQGASVQRCHGSLLRLPGMAPNEREVRVYGCGLSFEQSLVRGEGYSRVFARN